MIEIQKENSFNIYRWLFERKKGLTQTRSREETRKAEAMDTPWNAWAVMGPLGRLVENMFTSALIEGKS